MSESGLAQWAKKVRLDLTAEQLAAFQEFEAALYEANEVMNLTRVPREECWLRHFVDSLLFQDLIPFEARVLDLGTGPGLPAWPLACARPDLKVTGLDSNGKMLGFLRSHLLPNLAAVQARAEEWEERQNFECVTGRAVAPLPIQLELSAAFASIGGWVMPMRTPNEDFEMGGLKGLGLKLRGVVTRELPGTEVVRALPMYEKIAVTERRFPRRWADMKKAPLGS